MIETPTSAAAHVAENAQRALDTATEELAALQASAEEARAELRDLLAERDQSQQRGAALAATVEALRADLERLRLAEEMAAGTPLASSAHEATAHASALWSDASSDLQAHAGAWEPRAAQIEQRLGVLAASLEDSASVSRGLHTRIDQLRGVFASNHAQHGRDAQQALEAEFAALAERRAAILQQLAAVDQEEAALRDQIPARLAAWPHCARESIGAHLAYQASPWAEVLRHWQAVMQLVGDDGRVVDRSVWHAFVGETTVPLPHLTTFAPRSRWEAPPETKRDQPLRQFGKMERDLGETRARLEAQERERQVFEQLEGQ